MNSIEKPKILIVDDSALNLKILCSYLKDLYKITVASNGVEAWKLLSDDYMPDLILLDVIMPEMDGYELCQKIKEQPLFKKIPIIFITSLDEERSEIKGFELGAVDYIVKPFNIEIVKKRIELQLELKAYRETLEERVEEEICKGMERDKILQIQSRQAAMGEMINNIAHQWKQPLSSLGLMVQTLPLYYENGKINKEFLENKVKTMMEFIFFMSQTIDDFRNFFKPEMEKKNFSLNHSIEKSLEFMSATFKHLSIQTKFHHDGDLNLLGYSNELTQVFLNLLSNARDQILQKNVKEPRVNITVKKFSDKVRIAVSDNAGGIPLAMMKNLFTPYFTTKKDGTGIGLYMCKIIIEEHFGGTIEARNHDGGAEFIIELPL